MEIITGYTGKPHVTSEQDRDVNIGVVGEGSYVLQTGMQLAAEVSSNNEIKIRDGVLIHQGCTASIKKNTYDSLTIINGSQGMKRVDLIVARYEKNQDNGIESLDLRVIQGTPAESNPAAPQYTEGDIQAGDYVADMPMYQVIIDGLNITEVKEMFKVIGSNKDLTDRISKAGTYELLADTKSTDYISVSVDLSKYKAYLLMVLADSYTRPLASITIPAIYAKTNTTPDRTIQCSDGGESTIYAAHMYFEPSTSQIKVRSRNATYCRVRLYGIL